METDDFVFYNFNGKQEKIIKEDFETEEEEENFYKEYVKQNIPLSAVVKDYYTKKFGNDNTYKEVILYYNKLEYSEIQNDTLLSFIVSGNFDKFTDAVYKKKEPVFPIYIINVIKKIIEQVFAYYYDFINDDHDESVQNYTKKELILALKEESKKSYASKRPLFDRIFKNVIRTINNGEFVVLGELYVVYMLLTEKENAILTEYFKEIKYNTFNFTEKKDKLIELIKNIIISNFSMFHILSHELKELLLNNKFYVSKEYMKSLDNVKAVLLNENHFDENYITLLKTLINNGSIETISKTRIATDKIGPVNLIAEFMNGLPEQYPTKR